MPNLPNIFLRIYDNELSTLFLPLSQTSRLFLEYEILVNN